MARLPRYRPLGARISSLPTVDYAGTARAQARVAQSIGQQLDRMASVAFREAEMQAKIEGAEYGATNAPTAQELLDMQSEEERAELMPGGTGTVYDRAAREAALRVIGVNLETAARDEIATARINAKNNFTPVDQLQTEIDGIINGYSGALYDISPASAPQLRASLASVGNSAAIAHTTLMADQAKKAAEFNATKGMEGIVNDIQPRVYAAATKSADEVLNIVTSERQKIIQLADIIDDDAKLAQYMGDLNQGVDKALVGVVTDWAAQDPMKHRQQWIDGKVEDVAVKNVMALMTPEQRRDAFKAINQAESDYYSRLSQQEAVIERENKAEITRLVGEFNKVLINGNIQDVDRLFGLLNPLDPDKAMSMRDAFYQSGGTDELQTVYDLQLASSQGRLTEDMILDAINSRRLSKTSSGTFFNALASQNNAEHQDAMRLVRAEFGIPDSGMFVLDEGGLRAEAMQTVARFQSELIKAERADPNVDRIALAEAFIAKGNAQKALKGELSTLKNSVNQVFNDILVGVDRDDRAAVVAASLAEGKRNPNHKHDKFMENINRIDEINATLGAAQ